MYEYEYTENGQINIYKTVDKEKTLVHYQPGFESEDDGKAFAEAHIEKLESIDAFIAEESQKEPVETLQDESAPEEPVA